MCLAIPGKIVEIVPGGQRSGVVDVAGVRRRVELGLLDGDRPETGDWVLIHVGFAMSKISEADAAEQMRVLRALGEADAAMEEIQGYSADDAEPALAAGPTEAGPARAAGERGAGRKDGS